jgi:predicted outer membrane repeat protein
MRRPLIALTALALVGSIFAAVPGSVRAGTTNFYISDLSAAPQIGGGTGCDYPDAQVNGGYRLNDALGDIYLDEDFGSGDTIFLCDLVGGSVVDYQLDGDIPLIVFSGEGDEVTIKSILASSHGELNIDANGYSGFQFGDAVVTLDGFRVYSAYTGSDPGAAVWVDEYNYYTELHLIDMAFVNSYAEFGVSGGAVYVEGDVTVDGSYFFNNGTQNGGDGGAIYATGDVTVTDSGFDDNEAEYGGAIYSEGDTDVTGSAFGRAYDNNDGNYSWEDGGAIYSEGDVIATDSTFTDNYADDDGGALSLDGTGDIEVVNSIFDNNDSDYGSITSDAGDVTLTDVRMSDGDADGGYGGAVYAGYITATSSSFTNNTANDDGGALYADVGMELTDSVFRGNSADYGGALYGDDNSTIDISHCVFVKNSATSGGGAVYGETVNATHSLFRSNTAEYGGAIAAYPGESVLVGAPAIDHNRFIGNVATAGEGPALYLWVYEGDTLKGIKRNAFSSRSYRAYDFIMLDDYGYDGSHNFLKRYLAHANRGLLHRSAVTWY